MLEPPNSLLQTQSLVSFHASAGLAKLLFNDIAIGKSKSERILAVVVVFVIVVVLVVVVIVVAVAVVIEPLNPYKANQCVSS